MRARGIGLLALWMGTAWLPESISTAAELAVSLSWGHASAHTRAFQFRVRPALVKVVSVQTCQFEKDDSYTNELIQSAAGGGDIDSVRLQLAYEDSAVRPRTEVQSIWRYLLDNTSADAAQRLLVDPAFRPDPRQITFEMNRERTLGFTLTVDQLLRQGCFWFPELDVFVSTGPQPETFEQHQRIHPRSRARILEEVEEGPEATYEQFAGLWADMGSPQYTNRAAPEPGHIVCLGWDSSLYKVGVDRFAGVRNDLGSRHHFRCEFEFGVGAPDRETSWRSQRLMDGLPVVATVFERDGVRYQVEQFVAPLSAPVEPRGAADLVLLQRTRLTALDGKTHRGRVAIRCRQELPAPNETEITRTSDSLLWRTADGTVLLRLEGPGLEHEASTASATNSVSAHIELTLSVPAEGAREFVVKLPSPPAASNLADLLARTDYDASRDRTVQFWAEYLRQGARFEVPEAPVNELFRANLWHALRLPRRRSSNPLRIDLPYSNFAYDQRGTPWPINQAVYVDYMLYDLRGYHAIAAEELAAIFSNNQEADGRVGGFANWGVYTPGMLYAVAKNYLLSGDAVAFDGLLPRTLKALDWCLGQMESSRQNRSAPGLVLAPLNDLSHENRAWAFNQAYLFAGTDLLARALARYGHPRAQECRWAAERMQEAIQREFGRAAVRAPAVQLRDGTFSLYVPGDALTPRRLPEVWYPTDVDCGPVHLARLGALAPSGLLTRALLNDHEDNLFLNNWGMANEPVYNQQATVYLLQDKPQAAIRAFYSMMTCAFSQTLREPVEHRWAWGQYFGPPSTDGAWFELYRNMLLQEREGDSLLLLQATPRPWLEAGKQILVERAPTYFGPLSMRVRSGAEARTITAEINLSGNRQPAELLVRFRHPEKRLLRNVRLNGKPWADFAPLNEWVRVPSPRQTRYEITAGY